MNIANLYPQPRNSHKKLFILQHLKSADPACSKGERVKGTITSSKGQELITSSKGQEARSKMSGIRGSGTNCKQQGASFGSLGKQFGASSLWIQKVTGG